MSGGRREVMLVALVLLAATIVVTWPLGFVLTRQVSGHSDTYFGVWRLAWIADALRSSDLRVFDAPIFYPHLRTLAWSDAVLLPGVLAAPLRYAGLSPAIVYNLTLLAGFVSSGVALFCLSRRWTGRADAALLAAMIFTLAPYRLDHLDHLEMQIAAWMPLALWLWHRAVDGAGARFAALACAALVAQWFSCIYYGLLFALPFALVVVIEMPGLRAADRARVIGAITGTAIAGAIAIAIYSQPYLANHDLTGDRSVDDVRSHSATIYSYVATPPGNLLYGRALSGFGDGEARLFPGLAATLLASVGVLAGPWSRRRWAYLAAGLAAFDLSLGMNGLLFPILRDWLLPFRGLRAPARAGIVVLLVVSLFAGHGAAAILSRFTRKRAAALVTAAIALVTVFEYRQPPHLWEVHLAPVMKELGIVRGSVIVEMPMAPPERLDRSEDAHYMISRIGAWPSLVNGYSGYYPDDYLTFLDRTRAFPDERSIREMARIGVDVLIVHESRYGEQFPELVRELNARTDIEQVGRYLDDIKIGDARWVAVYQVLKP